MKGLFDNWEERNKFLIKRYYVRRWIDKVGKLKKRDKMFETAMKEMDKKYLNNCAITLADICQSYRVDTYSSCKSKRFLLQSQKSLGRLG